MNDEIVSARDKIASFVSIHPFPNDYKALKIFKSAYFGSKKNSAWESRLN